jgi:hypothetical protein
VNDYIYGAEAEQFSFLRVPKVLLQHEAYKHLSAEAKLLYSLFLDRVGMSMKNGWMDDQKRIFIIFTVDEIRDCLNCGRGKAIQLLNELEENAGLIERRRQGLTKPNLIYVKSLIRVIDENGNVNFLKFGNETSRSSKIEIQEVRESDSNKNEINKTERNKTSLPFLSEREGNGMEEYLVCESEFRESLNFEALLREHPYDREILEGILDLLVEICCSNRKTICIAGDEKPLIIVQNKLKKLNADHITFVLDGLKENTTRIRDIKQYLLAALFNAPSTIASAYQAKVNHELYGVLS